MGFQRLRHVALVLAMVAAGCMSDSTSPPSTAVLTAPTSPGAVPLSCPPSVERQSVDALPVQITWPIPTVAGVPVDKGSCSPVSGTSFPIGSSTVTCTADEPSYASACSFGINITPPDPKLRFTRFMAFGDSITEGFVGDAAFAPDGNALRIPALLRSGGISRAVQPLNAYPAVLQNLLTPAYLTQRFTVANEGLSGERAVQGQFRLMSALLASRPEVMMLFEGFNDIDLAILNRGPNSTAPIDVRPIAAALQSMVFMAEGLGVEVLLATLTPTTEVREESDPGTLAAILDLNDEIRAMAPTFGRGGVVDLYSMLDGVPGMISADGFHPTVAGYRRIGEIFFAEIVSRHDVTPRAPTTLTAR